MLNSHLSKINKANYLEFDRETEGYFCDGEEERKILDEWIVKMRKI